MSVKRSCHMKNHRLDFLTPPPADLLFFALDGGIWMVKQDGSIVLIEEPDDGLPDEPEIVQAK